MRTWIILCFCLVCCQATGEKGPRSKDAGLVDDDGDGITVDDDCDDNDPDLFPGNDSVDVMGDGVDNNCDGHDGVDLDGDGFATSESGGDDCDDTDPGLTPADVDADGFSSCDGDCDDSSPYVAPDLPETCDGVDTDCDGALDEDADGVDLCLMSDIFGLGGAVDVLFVVDNSCSMAEEQQRLANNGVDFLTPLIGHDIHVGVITTDLTDASQSGRLRTIAGLKWIDDTFDQFDAENFFDLAIQAGTNGDWNEAGRDAAYQALAVLNNAYNTGFSRSTAPQHIVVLTDENDHSTGVQVGNFITWMSTFKADPTMTVWHSIVAPQPICPAAIEVGTDYLAMSTATGGMTASICAPDYGPLMSTLAQSIVPMGNEDLVFTLSEVPVEATLEVWITEPGILTYLVDPADWSYVAAGNTVELLGLVVLDGSLAEISYRKAT